MQACGQLYQLGGPVSLLGEQPTCTPPEVCGAAQVRTCLACNPGSILSTGGGRDHKEVTMTPTPLHLPPTVLWFPAQKAAAPPLLRTPVPLCTCGEVLHSYLCPHRQAHITITGQESTTTQRPPLLSLWSLHQTPGDNSLAPITGGSSRVSVCLHREQPHGHNKPGVFCMKRAVFLWLPFQNMHPSPGSS